MTSTTRGSTGRSKDHPVIHEGTVEIDADAPSEIREFVRNVAAGSPRLDDAMLLASEVATNAIIHGSWLPGDQLDISIRRAPGQIVFELTGPGEVSDLTPVRSEPGGFGLTLVDQLSAAWDISQIDQTTHVRFELRW